MKDSDKNKLEDIASKINDGKSQIDLAKEFDTKESEVIFQALKKINQAAQIIRKQGRKTTTTINENDTWAHLKIHEKIGQGGIGKVYRAFDSALNCDVAVKFLKQNSQLHISADKFLQEARNMAKVRHPHVLAIHGAIIDKGVAGYWSDYLDGQLLSNSLLQQPIQAKQQIIIAQELSSALFQIHKNKIVHGDIKPQNVMVQPHRGAILLDFGSSRKQKVKNQNQNILHASPMAMAPEQFNGQPPTTASDIFSLGLLFWNLNTGKHPLDGCDLEEIQLQAHNLKSEQQQLKGSKDWQNLIIDMIDINPKLRPNIQQVVDRLFIISQKPMQRAKRLTYGALLALAFGITLISMYSSYKTNHANKETQALNTILSDILLNSSPMAKGKDTLLIDVLDDAKNALLNNQYISEQQRAFNLTKLVKTYRQQGKNDKALSLATKLLEVETLNNSLKLDLLLQKSAVLNENRDYKQAEELMLKAIAIKPATKHDSDVLVSAFITLIHTYNESYELENVPKLIAQAKQMYKGGTGKLSYLANIFLIEGNYYEIKEQYETAFEHYQQSVENYEKFYGAKNLDVMIAKGARATVLTYQQQTLEKGADMLNNVVSEMTDFLGEDHSSTLIARINLADAYSQLDQPQLAIDTIVPHMPSVYKAYGELGGMTLLFKNMIASFYTAANQPQQAEVLLKEIIVVQTSKHGKDAKQTLEAKLNRVLFLHEKMDFKKAAEILVSIHETALKSLPNDARLTLDIQEHLLWNLFNQGDNIAVISMQELLNKKIKIFGEQDPSTISTTKQLAKMKE